MADARELIAKAKAFRGDLHEPSPDLILADQLADALEQALADLEAAHQEIEAGRRRLAATEVFAGLDEIRSEAARLRHALQWYADAHCEKMFYVANGCDGAIEVDNGRRALEALKPEAGVEGEE